MSQFRSPNNKYYFTGYLSAAFSTVCPIVVQTVIQRRRLISTPSDFAAPENYPQRERKEPTTSAPTVSFRPHPPIKKAFLVFTNITFCFSKRSLVANNNSFETDAHRWSVVGFRCLLPITADEITGFIK